MEPNFIQKNSKNSEENEYKENNNNNNNKNIENYKIQENEEEKINQFDPIYFPKWEKLKYFALKNREKFPNLFFYFFNYKGIITKNFSKEDIKKLISFLTSNSNSNSSKKYNGLWGFVSLYFENKNGIEIFKYISKLEIFNSGFSVPCVQDGKAYDEETKENFIGKFEYFGNYYGEVENKFEDYLKRDNEKRKELITNDTDKNQEALLTNIKSKCLIAMVNSV